MDNVCLFSTSLAAGMTWAMSVTSSDQVNPGFFRTSVLVVLGLIVLAILAIWGEGSGLLLATLVPAAIVSYAASMAWQLEWTGVGRVLLLFLSALLLGALWESSRGGFRFANAAAGAAVLGVSMSAMLLGHYYLTAPWMSLRPLYQLLVGILVTSAARLALALFEPNGFLNDAMHSSSDMVSGSASQVEWWFYVVLRWVMGIAAPILLSIMAWRTLRLRHTQAATGILYVVVIMTFIGEATGIALSGRLGGTIP